MRRAPFAVIPCSKEKAWDAPGVVGPRPARLAYRSPLFAAALAWAERRAERVLIFSALHGLLAADDVVPGPYDVTFSRPDDPVVSREHVAAQAVALGIAALGPDAAVLCALPDDYAARLADALGEGGPRLDNALAEIPLHHLAAMRERLLAAKFDAIAGSA
ncbi:MAG: hypothetical protein H6747_08165 [Deltaproteobacteria bacterium]|nr:hypothetical protein [Deltaproteobacteria bacterium]